MAKPIYTVLPDYFAHRHVGCRVFRQLIEYAGDEISYFTAAPLTRRQVRQIRRQLRNFTLPVFDSFGPDPLKPDMHRMKGARQAYKRREVKDVGTD